MLFKKKFYLIAPILFLLIIALFSGCSNNAEKLHEPEPRILLANSPFVQEYENMQYLLDAIQRRDEDYLKQLILENKVFSVDKDTHVDNIGTMADINHEVIIFKEGRYTNKKGITLKNSLLTEEEYQSRIEKAREEERQRQLAIQKAKEEEIQRQAEKERQERRNLLINYISDVFNKTMTCHDYALSSDNLGVLFQIKIYVKDANDKLNNISNNAIYDANDREMAKKAQLILEKHYKAFQYYTQFLENKDVDVELKYISLYNKTLKETTNLIESFNSEYGFGL